MFGKLDSILQHECKLVRDRPVIAAVSGGPDSLCLLDCLWRLGYAVIVAHFNHGLRPEAGAEAEAVRRTTERMGVPFVQEQANVRRFQEESHLSLEEAARTLRYRFLFEQAHTSSAQAVAVGHTADDQVETVLMHLLRGAGSAGLRGMRYRSLPNAWSDTIPLARPLLGVWRSQVMETIAQRGLEPVMDPSNQDTTFYRNRLRHELIPYLQGYNPRIKDVLWRTAEVLGEEYAVLEENVEKAWDNCMTMQSPGAISFDPTALRAQPAGIQRMLMRRAVSLLQPGLRDVDFASVERALKFLASPLRSGKSDLAAGLRLLLEDGRFWLAKWEADLPGLGWPQVPPGKELALPVPGEMELPEGWVLQAVRLPVEATLERDPHPYQAWLDAASLEAPLHVRGRRPGERFQPLGMGEHSLKLSDFMINAGLPRRARDGWPLVCSGQAVAWVPGFRPAHFARLTEATREVVHITLFRNSGTDER